MKRKRKIELSISLDKKLWERRRKWNKFKKNKKNRKKLSIISKRDNNDLINNVCFKIF